MGRVAADVKIHIKSLLPMASCFSLTRAVSLLLIVVMLLLLLLTFLKVGLSVVV